MPEPTNARPRFKTEAEERAYWDREDSAKDLDWSQAVRVTLPNLRPSSDTINIGTRK